MATDKQPGTQKSNPARIPMTGSGSPKMAPNHDALPESNADTDRKNLANNPYVKRGGN